MSERNDGGPAFGGSYDTVFVSPDGLVEPQKIEFRSSGMSLRDWFAGTLQVDDRLVRAVRAMDDTDLAIFAQHPDSEREGWEADADYHGLDAVEKITKRLQVEARAISRARYMQADAMLAEREK